MKAESNKNIAVIFFVILLAFSSFMSLRGTPFAVIRSTQVLALVLILLTLSSTKFAPMKKKGLVVKKYVWLFMLVPWLSLIPAYVSHGQNPIESALVLTVETGLFLLYFLFVKWNVTENQLLKVLGVFAFIYTFFELFQQVTYPTYWFAGRGDSEVYDNLEKRLGLWKFYMFGIHFLVVALFFYWEKILQKAKFVWLFGFSFLAIGLYAFLARKMLLAFFICIIFSLFLGKSIKWYYWIFFIFGAAVIFINLDSWFGEYIELTTANLEAGDEWSRNRSRDFFLTYFDDPLCLILGNGKDSGSSDYGKYIRGIAEWPSALRRGDIGIYAHFSFYGIVGMIPVLSFVIFIIKKWRYLPLYIKLYFIFHLTQVTVAFPFYSINNAATLAIVLYLMEINIANKMLLEREMLVVSKGNMHSGVGSQAKIGRLD